MISVCVLFTHETARNAAWRVIPFHVDGSIIKSSFVQRESIRNSTLSIEVCHCSRGRGRQRPTGRGQASGRPGWVSRAASRTTDPARMDGRPADA